MIRVSPAILVERQDLGPDVAEVPVTVHDHGPLVPVDPTSYSEEDGFPKVGTLCS
jgi:hypothetical protein